MIADPVPVVPARDPITAVLDELRRELLPLNDGEVASYIPALANADPSLFGLALCTLDGQIYDSGDAGVEFTIQSVSKPFVYALALGDRGLEEVLAHVGVEPTGDAFNSIRLEAGTGRPANPMVNAGAIACTSLIAGDDPGRCFARILEELSRFAGRRLEVDEAVFASEHASADRNRALAYLMRNAGSLDADIEDTLAVYHRQCSVRVSARDLAVMAATLANGGVNPLTGEHVANPFTAEHVLTVMATCGMYDYAGEWLLRVGLPAKGGVSGSLTAVLPAQCGLGLFSPPLDARGNSVRAVAACRQLSDRFNLHLMHSTNRAERACYLIADGAERPSSQVRTAREREILAREGTAVAIRGLTGELDFAATEPFTRTLPDEIPDARWLVLDVHRVNRARPIGATLLDVLFRTLTERGIATVLVDPDDRLEAIVGPVRDHTLDGALRYCEEDLLWRARSREGAP